MQLYAQPQSSKLIKIRSPRLSAGMKRADQRPHWEQGEHLLLCECSAVEQPVVLWASPPWKKNTAQPPGVPRVCCQHHPKPCSGSNKPAMFADTFPERQSLALPWAYRSLWATRPKGFDQNKWRNEIIKSPLTWPSPFPCSSVLGRRGLSFPPGYQNSPALLQCCYSWDEAAKLDWSQGCQVSG